jgi:hypothetical protein
MEADAAADVKAMQGVQHLQQAGGMDAASAEDWLGLAGAAMHFCPGWPQW